MKKPILDQRKIIFFDGVCHLCDNFVNFVYFRDMTHSFHFAPLQGSTAKSILGIENDKKLDTIMYYDEGVIYQRSTAILKIISGLGGIYKLLVIGWLIPRPIRDTIYDWIAKNRYSWFGKNEFCRMPSPEEKNYILP